MASSTKMKIENMREQHHNIIKADEAVQKNRKFTVKPEKDFGFVAVAAGAGIEALFRDLGRRQRSTRRSDDEPIHGGYPGGDRTDSGE